MAVRFTNSELEAFLDEALPVEKMTAIEEALRASDELQKRVAAINGRRDAGVHSLGEIWRRQRARKRAIQQVEVKEAPAMAEAEASIGGSS